MGTRASKELDPNNGKETDEIDPGLGHETGETIRDVEIVSLAILFLWVVYLSHKWFTNKKKNKTENQKESDKNNESHNIQDPTINSTVDGEHARHGKNDEPTTCYTFEREFENYWKH